MDLFSKKYSRTKHSCSFSGFKGSDFLGMIIAGAGYGLGLFEMQLELSNHHVLHLWTSDI